jgi:dephospho-CoA kinase
MKVIGLTGGIGSGKSTVSQYLAELGATIIDADKVGHEALRTAEVKQEISTTFGHGVFAPDGEIDRKKLGEIVFSNPESLAKLNGIMHHRMRAMMVGRIEECRQQKAKAVIVEAAVLLETEADWTSLVDEIWVTATHEMEVLKRITEQRGLSEEQVLARIHSQLSHEERAEQANVVIDNDGDVEDVKVKVKRLWERLQA